ncbi:hypothetical protein [Telluribacter humicola]|uniref:hypothetical protein n=1 Tax=Telluribacter humicola TaxID=1720261 RepID=UPI001A979713|nr:hypothetical protein [Telluribacter humicola]
MKKKSEWLLPAEEIQEEISREESSPAEAITAEAVTTEAIEPIRFTGAFNGDSLSFAVEPTPQADSELVVELNETFWAKAALQSPLTVVRGYKLPATYRIRTYVQPINS